MWPVDSNPSKPSYPILTTSYPSQLVSLKVLHQWQHGHHREHWLDFDCSPPHPMEQKVLGAAVGWTVGGVGGGLSLSPGSGRWPSDVKVSGWPRLPEDMLGVPLCHAGCLQKLRSNRRRRCMLVTFLENVSVHVRSLSHSFQISSPALNKGRGVRLCIYVHPSGTTLCFLIPAFVGGHWSLISECVCACVPSCEAALHCTVQVSSCLVIVVYLASVLDS